MRAFCWYGAAIGLATTPSRPAPSNWSIAGRYILQPEIFDLLAEQEKGAGNEIQLTDSMAKLMNSQDFHAYVYEGATHDCGDKIGLLKANVALALKRTDLGPAARAAVEAALGLPETKELVFEIKGLEGRRASRADLIPE